MQEERVDPYIDSLRYSLSKFYVQGKCDCVNIVIETDGLKVMEYIKNPPICDECHKPFKIFIRTHYNKNRFITPPSFPSINP